MIAAGKPAQSKGLRPTPAKRLLVIDDDEIQRMHVRGLAQTVGYTVDPAASIAEAQRQMAVCTYDVMVVDLALDGEDGIEVLRAIKAAGQNPEIVVISGSEDRIRDAVVGYGRAMGLSMLGELRKPMQPTQFKTYLSNASQRAVRKAERAAAPEILRPELMRAISDGAIYASYQPQIDLASGLMVGAEALARWQSPIHGSVPPDIFVAAAERHGLERQLTDLILNQALQAAKPWVARCPNFRVAVNVPATVFSKIEFADSVFAMLSRVGLPPANLTLELTESAAHGDIAASIDVMCRLRIGGVHLSLDDYGTGFSSLARLRASPVGELKIDRSFVTNMDTDNYSNIIVQATIAMAKKIGMRIVAEGIETKAVADMLAREGADIGQGYLYARPMVAAEIAPRLPANCS
jgi:EAL domain-containing protein (putative c-di-GMP-specific phosphodiesterase class I)